MDPTPTEAEIEQATEWYAEKYSNSAQFLSQEMYRVIREAYAAALAKCREKFDVLRNTCIREDYEIQQILGKALGYPWFKDDQKNFPNATEDDGVCVGEHVAITLAMEAADRLVGYRACIETERERCAKIAENLDDFPDLHAGQMRFGLRCGLEDREIGCPYEAAEYGFEDAIERCLEWAKNIAAAIRGGGA